MVHSKILYEAVRQYKLLLRIYDQAGRQVPDLACRTGFPPCVVCVLPRGILHVVASEVRRDEKRARQGGEECTATGQQQAPILRTK